MMPFAFKPGRFEMEDVFLRKKSDRREGEEIMESLVLGFLGSWVPY